MFTFAPKKSKYPGMEQSNPTITNRVLMIRPANFGYNAETAVNNAFQKVPRGKSHEIAQKALAEFNALVELLKEHQVVVEVIDDTPKPNKPDALFPNNWISFHSSGTLVTYPMFAPSRRHERREDVIAQIGKKYNISRRYSFEMYEAQDEFLEGTGSMILDRRNKICYACLSTRTEITLLNKFGLIMGYEIVHFTAVDEADTPIYHTNVIMALGEDFVVVAREAIQDPEEWSILSSRILSSGKSIVEISMEQVRHFAGNMLQLSSLTGERLIVMSTQAFKSLEKGQLSILSQSSKIIHTPLDTIETYGGGSARCMIAEIFLPPKTAV